jgi:hypothetical protein
MMTNFKELLLILLFFLGAHTLIILYLGGYNVYLY